MTTFVNPRIGAKADFSESLALGPYDQMVIEDASPENDLIDASENTVVDAGGNIVSISVGNCLVDASNNFVVDAGGKRIQPGVGPYVQIRAALQSDLP